jgi:hypothetical protein
MIYTTTENSVLAVKLEILDELDQPVVCKPGYPKVLFRDKDKNVISTVIATPSVVPGEWLASVNIPNLNLTAKTEFNLRWKAIATDGSKYYNTDALLVEPQLENRESDIVAMFGDTTFSFSLPFKMEAGIQNNPYSAVYQVYTSNQAFLTTQKDILGSNDVTVDGSAAESSVITAPLEVAGASLYPNLLKVVVTSTTYNVNKTILFKLWAVTPQILLEMSELEDQLNKAKVENTIPQLRYTTADLIGYLERGLYLFNMIYMPTAFNGLNMQGLLQDAHLICSMYYALSAQILAEGSLSFDFSGQGISLNVDRTPALESALGRIETLIDQRVVPLKKQLIVNGVTGGDGSAGNSSILNPYNKGTLGVINAPTTRISNPSSRAFGRTR